MTFLPSGIFTNGIFNICHFYQWHLYHMAFLPMAFLPMAILPMAFLPMAFLPHTPRTPLEHIRASSGVYHFLTNRPPPVCKFLDPPLPGVSSYIIWLMILPEMGWWLAENWTLLYAYPIFR